MICPVASQALATGHPRGPILSSKHPNATTIPTTDAHIYTNWTPIQVGLHQYGGVTLRHQQARLHASPAGCTTQTGGVTPGHQAARPGVHSGWTYPPNGGRSQQARKGFLCDDRPGGRPGETGWPAGWTRWCDWQGQSETPGRLAIPPIRGVEGTILPRPSQPIQPQNLRVSPLLRLSRLIETPRLNKGLKRVSFVVKTYSFRRF